MRLDRGARILWARWVGANAVAECLGLGLVALVAVALGPRLGAREDVGAQLGFAAALILAGAIEGLVVGFAQSWVLRTVWPGITSTRWTRATVFGALLAWVLGMLPSTIIGLHGSQNAASAGPAAGEPGPWIVYPAAAILGAVAGIILSGFQWRELRCHVQQAGRWLPANAAAWALGMPLLFVLVEQAAAVGLPWAIPLAIFGLGLTGAVVGAVHGVALVWLAEQPEVHGTRSAGVGAP